MMNEIFENNMKVLQERYIDIYNNILEYELENESVIIDESLQGEQIIAVNRDNHLYYLNSRYSDCEYVKNWMTQYSEIKFKEVFVIFGGANFSCIKSLTEKINKDNMIMIYEPDFEIFIKSIQITDITDIICNRNIFLCVKNYNDKIFEDFLTGILKYSTKNNFRTICMLNYEKLYADVWREILETIKNRYKSIFATRNFEIKYSGDLIENYLSSCEDMIEQSGINIMRDAFRNEKDLGELPVVIVSAGPSLNKNIKDLKKAEDRVFIIAVDTSLKALLNNNIIPDMVVTVDPHKDLVLFAHKNLNGIPMIIDVRANKGLKYMHSGKRFYFDFSDTYISYLYYKHKHEQMQIIETGGSVANDAFSVAMILGFKKIILIGQDLAYTDKKGHVQDAYAGAEENIDELSNKYFEVEDIYGNKVLTEDNMDMYRKWFEAQILRYPMLDVIDATEGGAKIKGTKIMTLNEVIERECKAKIDKSFIGNIESAFNEDEKEKIRQELDSLEEKLEEIRKEIKKGIRKYEKIEELFRKNKAGTKEFKTIIKDIDEIVKMTEEEPVMYMVKMYTAMDEYEILEDVYDVKDEIQTEIREIVDKGTKMFNSYIKAIDSLKDELIKRKQFNKEEYNSIVKAINENINELEEKISEDNVVEINKIMKEFYNIVMNVIDTQYRINKEYYKQSEELLRNVTEKYTDKEYSDMLNIIKFPMIKSFMQFSKYMEETM